MRASTDTPGTTHRLAVTLVSAAMVGAALVIGLLVGTGLTKAPVHALNTPTTTPTSAPPSTPASPAPQCVAMCSGSGGLGPQGHGGGGTLGDAPGR